MAEESLIVGWREWVHLPDLLDEPIKAKIDTGARTSALHAWDIEEFSRDGRRWLRFWLHPRQNDDDHVVETTAPLLGKREVRSSNGEVEIRPLIRTTVAIGDRRFLAKLTLTNRDQMSFRMLLGRTALRRRVLVDADGSYHLGHPEGR